MTARTQRKSERPVARTRIGWREWISIPEWNIAKLKCKIDTGARSSAIDVVHVEELSDGRVRFGVVTSKANRDRPMVVEAPIVRRTHVRPSSGNGQERIVVAASIHMGGISKQVEFTLVDRQGMLCRALLGRRALVDDFVVDVGHKYLLGVPDPPESPPPETS